MRYDWNETANNNGYVQVYKNYQHARFLSNDASFLADFTDETLGFDAQQNIKLDDKNELTTGIEYYKTSVENEFAYRGEKSINNKAIFAEHRWKFNDSWQLNTGLRYDKHNMYGSEVTPKIALNKKINADSNVFVSWGKVFNAPTVDDLYNNNPSMGYGNPNLKPEKGDVWTLGGNTKLGYKTNLSASIYYSEINDAIDWDWTKSPAVAENINTEKRRGLEVSVNHEFDEHLSAYLSYSYMQIKQDKGNGYQRNTNEKPNTYHAGLKYKNAGWTYNADLIAVSGQQVRVGGGYHGYTDRNYCVIDLGAQYKVNSNLKVFANIYNLTDTRYQELGGIYAEGPTWIPVDATYPMPSRSFIIGAEYTF